jgi:hypothetical protein
MRVHSIESIAHSDYFRNHRKVIFKPGESADARMRFLLDSPSNTFGDWIIRMGVRREDAQSMAAGDPDTIKRYVQEHEDGSQTFPEGGAILVANKGGSRREIRHITPSECVKEVSMMQLLHDSLQQILELRLKK